MKYPRLKDKDNLSRKLTDEDIKHIQEDFQQNFGKYSPTSIRNKLAQQYHVSYATIYYWTNDKFREEKRKKDNPYWSQLKDKDYQKWHDHKVQEINRRRNRMLRNPDLKLWNEVISAKNEKRVKRKTVRKKPLQSYDDK